MAETNLAVLIQPRDFEQALAMAEKLAVSALIPKAYQPKLYASMDAAAKQEAIAKAAANIVIAWDLGASIGFSAMQALQSIAVIGGKPVLYEDAPLAVIRASGTLEKIIETFDEESMTARCEAWRKGQDTPSIGEYALADAAKATVWEFDEDTKKSTPKPLSERWTYKAFPKDMLKYRARGRALKPLFADVLKGLGIGEEVRDFQAATPPSEREDRAGVIEMQRTAEDTYMPRETPEPVVEAPGAGEPGTVVDAPASEPKGEAAARVDKILATGERPAAEKPKAAPKATAKKPPVEPPASPAPPQEPAGPVAADPDAPPAVLTCAVCLEPVGEQDNALRKGDDWIHAECVGGPRTTQGAPLPAPGLSDMAVPTEFVIGPHSYKTNGMTEAQMRRSFDLTTGLAKITDVKELSTPLGKVPTGKNASAAILALFMGYTLDDVERKDANGQRLVSRLLLTEAKAEKFNALLEETLKRAQAPKPEQQPLA